MNYYERYCGDYAKKTAKLTLIQHGAYTLLLDEYYSTEEPLSSDFDELYRICRAMSKVEQEAVRFVADRFFPIDSDGLRHNGRADEMIAKARPKMEAARENGKKGGRPRKNPSGYESGNPEETQEEPTGKPTGFLFDNPEETQSESSPTPTPKKNHLSSVRTDDSFDRFWAAWPSTDRKVGKSKCSEQWVRGRLRETVDAIVAHVEQQKSSNRQWLAGYEPAPLTYLRQRRWEDGEGGVEIDNPFPFAL